MFYMFYDGNDPSWQTVMFVARTNNGPLGPFLKLTQRGTWEANPPDPQVIVYPANNTGSSSYYGAGNASVVAANGLLYMWYADDTLAYPNPPQGGIVLRTSTDAIHWSAPTPTNVYEPVGEVKWDSIRNVFLRWIITLNLSNGASSPVLSTSTDGVTFTSELTINPAASFPSYGGSGAIFGDARGWLWAPWATGQTYMFFAAPYNLDPSYHAACTPQDLANHATNCATQLDIYGGLLTGFRF
jgi:hypothetical protein